MSFLCYQYKKAGSTRRNLLAYPSFAYKKIAKRQGRFAQFLIVKKTAEKILPFLSLGYKKTSIDVQFRVDIARFL